MSLFTYVLFVCVFVLCKSEASSYDDFSLIDSIFQEPECSTHGGMCVVASDCSGELTKEKGLCPKQSGKGVECCQGISRKETRCRKVGGVCMPLDTFCSERILFSAATDCHKQKCCILVK
ncbi:U-scoloptoxin(19)-Sm1a [Amyelois transitella]|uniref:U-scoloptoxin(19)-Sm1a n=1 Tax=Amyelois transitella TaxID=680683 RepID=UPI00298FC11B|nr:U-scoloptoxin(19)-Sm1a [Amyelois transitella]